MKIIKQLWLAVTLIVAASLLLLISDLGQRNNNQKPGKYYKITIMQISSTQLLDAHVAGIVDRLESSGMVAPGRVNIQHYNPQGDFPTANTIAQDIVNSGADIVITSSTLALQIFSKANVTVKKPHVFGAVTDPYGAGVGITGKNPEDHPPYLAGIGTFQPVERAFIIAKDMNPSLEKVGVVWNSGEQCSEACTMKARAICEKLGITLVEAIAGNTSEVSEAAHSVISRGAQAIWIGGDTVATASVNLLVALASQAEIPVFTNDPTDVDRNALFGVGADYFTVGQYTADMAVDILRGRSPSEISIDNVIPELLMVNRQVLDSLENYRLTPEIESVLKEQEIPGAQKKESETEASVDSRQTFSDRNVRVAIINLIDNPTLEQAVSGVKEGLMYGGMFDERNMKISYYCAQGDMSILPQIIEKVVNDKPDVIITVTTPVQGAVIKRVKDIPVVFTVASDPYLQGLFTAESRPDNVCGVHDDPPVAEVLAMAADYVQGLERVGTVYDASQVNSRISVEKLHKAAKQRGIEVLEATVSNVSDLSMAARALIQRGAQALLFSADNLVYTGFGKIAEIADSHDIPTFATEPDMVEQNVTGAYGNTYFEWGVQSGKLAAKVLSGTPPFDLPIEPTKVLRRIDPKSKRAFSERNEPWKISIVLYSETEFAGHCRDGVIEGIKRTGLKEGEDYKIKVYNAHGDMSTLSSIMTTVKADRVDLLVPVSTPALQAALRNSGQDTKIVFTGVGDGVKAGAGKSETDHLPNVTGITTSSSFEGMARLISESVPGIKAVGTLFTPSEINSVVYRDLFEEELNKQGIQLVSVPVTSSSEVAQAADDLCSRDIQLVCQVVDNLTRPGFALIALKAREKGFPVFVFDSAQMKDGGAVSIARDYYDAGLEAAQKAVRVLKGEAPSGIPFNNTRSETYLVNYDLAQKYNLRLPEYMKDRARPYTIKKGE